MHQHDRPGARRHASRFLSILVLASSALTACSTLAPAPATSGPPSAATGFQQVSDHVWAFIAQDERSANGALFVGDDAALALDPGLTPEIARQFFAAIPTITDRPVKTVVLTHWHPDHALGVVCLKDRPYELVSTPQTRRNLADHIALARHAIASSLTDWAKRNELANCQINLPDRVINERTVFDLGGRTVEVWSPGVGHTSGDLIAWSPSEHVLATGDLFLNDSSPDMEEGSVAGLLADLNQLLRLPIDKVIPGHFAVTGASGLEQFRDYVGAVETKAQAAIDRGNPPARAGDEVSFPAFADFLQYPQYRATFADNVRAAARQYANRPAQPGEAHGFRILKRLKPGDNPHQISFSPTGDTAYIALAGSDRIARVDTKTLSSTGAIDIDHTPLGVASLGNGELLLARFGGTTIDRQRWTDSTPTASLDVGAGPSLLVGPLPDGAYLASVERANKLVVLDPKTMSQRAAYNVGARPFPPGVTADGRLAFVPNYDDASVSVIDLWNNRTLETVAVGAQPSGGAVLPGDIEYAVAVRGEDRIAFINTASHKVVSSLSDGVGVSPFSVVVSPSGRLAFVNNTQSHDVSVIALPEKRVVARIDVGEIPIVMAVHPSGKTLWISCEGTHEVDIVEIPNVWRVAADTTIAPRSGRPTQVAVMGMIHSQHRTSKTWGLEQVRQTIERFDPDVIVPEIPPDRWERVWSDYAERGVIEDPRVKRFPEYTDVLLPLKVQMGFAVAPAAAWTKEMSDLRNARIKEFDQDDRFANERAEYEKKTAQVQAADVDHIGDSDDPRVIHSDRYDQRIKAELTLYNDSLNDWIGPGGWNNINEGHYRLIDQAIHEHPGQRLLITFGSGHKYWILEQLRKRKDIELVDLTDYLPAP